MFAYNLWQWIAFFIIYCLIGWIGESLYVSWEHRKWVNRGFLHGPFLPIYGFGAVIILISTIPVRNNYFLIFLFGMLGATLLEYFTGRIGFPGELVPLTIVKMFSSSAATGLLLDIFKQFGTDSRLGMIASISLSCTETIFYTMSVYFMTAGIKKSRYTLAGALIATFAGLAASVLLA